MTYSFHVPDEKNAIDFFQKIPKINQTILENSGFQLASRWKHCCVDDQSSGVTSMVWWAYVGGSSMVGWGAPRAESTCKWPSEPLVWGHNGRRGNLPDLTI